MDYREIPKNKLDRLLDKYYKSKSTAVLDQIDELLKEQRKTLDQKLRRVLNERVNTNQE